MDSSYIKIATAFTDAPGARFKTDGPKSGEEFYEELLEPKFLEAKANGKKLTIDFDDCWGFASSFLSGSFGELSKNHGGAEVLEILEFVSKEDPSVIEKVRKEILEPTTPTDQ